MRLAQIVYTAAGSNPFPPDNGPHTAGWLRWFFIGAVALIIGIAWVCLRGYRNNSDGHK